MYRERITPLDPEELLQKSLEGMNPLVGETYLSLLGNAIDGKPWEFIRKEDVDAQQVKALSELNMDSSSLVKAFQVSNGFLVWCVRFPKLLDWYEEKLGGSFFWSRLNKPAAEARSREHKNMAAGLIPGERKTLGIYNLNSSPTTIVDGTPVMALPVTVKDGLPKGSWYSCEGQPLNPKNINHFLSKGEIAPSGRSLLYSWGY